MLERLIYKIRREGKRTISLYKCHCGKEFECLTTSVNTGNTKSCGCNKSRYRFKDISGNTYGRWKVLSFSGFRHNKNTRLPIFLCECSCGTKRDVLKESLVSGNSLSCGCYKKDNIIKSWGVKNRMNSAFNHLFVIYKSTAKRQGHCFKLTKEEFYKLVTSDCYLCGIKPSSVIKPTAKIAISKEFFYNGIDRIDSSIGYISGNVASCCTTCNRMKLDHNLDYFINHIKLIIKNYGFYSNINSN